jgi:hypothetical protein
MVLLFTITPVLDAQIIQCADQPASVIPRAVFARGTRFFFAFSPKRDPCASPSGPSWAKKRDTSFPSSASRATTSGELLARSTLKACALWQPVRQ